MYFRAMKRFTIRVYGIWINEQDEILVSDERIQDIQFTKFPGGGLEFGEGIRDCLVREWKEELDVAIEVLEHVYTTDFFQISAFDQTTQIISVYYRVQPREPLPSSVSIRSTPMDFTFEGREEIHFRFIPMHAFTAEHLTLPIDRHVATLLQTKTIT